MKNVTGLATMAAATLLPGFAHAHAGHVGELAGHSHWIAMGALAAAAAVAAIVATKTRKKQDEKPEGETADADTEAAQ